LRRSAGAAVEALDGFAKAGFTVDAARLAAVGIPLHAAQRMARR
jgi:hypothetical protein